jgi:membrane protein
MWLSNAAGERVPFSVLEFFGRVYQRINTDNVTGLAAQVSYYFALALFPFLILLGAIVGTLPFTHAWQGILPWIIQSLPADTRDTVFQAVANLTQGRKGFLSFGLLGTMWAAAGGLVSLSSALNTVYRVTETRSYAHRLLICVLMLFALAVLLLVSFGLVNVGDKVDHWLAFYGAPGTPPLLLLLPVARWMASVVLMILSISLMDHTLPNLKRRWQWVRPGMGLMVGGWLLASLGFNWYVRHVASYNRTYGVLGAFVVLMIWIYISTLIALSGAAIDAELTELQKGARSADGFI